MLKKRIGLLFVIFLSFMAAATSAGNYADAAEYEMTFDFSDKSRWSTGVIYDTPYDYNYETKDPLNLMNLSAIGNLESITLNNYGEWHLDRLRGHSVILLNQETADTARIRFTRTSPNLEGEPNYRDGGITSSLFEYDPSFWEIMANSTGRHRFVLSGEVVKTSGDETANYTIGISNREGTLSYYSPVDVVVKGTESQKIFMPMSNHLGLHNKTYHFLVDSESLNNPAEFEFKNFKFSYQAYVSLNYSPLEELMLLDGIGATLGQRIIDYRESVGYISSADDLLTITGIGVKTVQKIKDQNIFVLDEAY